MEEISNSLKVQMILAAVGLLLLVAVVKWCRKVLKTVRQVRSRESVHKELPDTFSRKPAFLLLGFALLILIFWMVFGIEPGDDIVIFIAFIPTGLVMGLTGLIDPRLMWAIYPDAAQKLPFTVRFVGATLCVLSVLGGLGWFLWFSLSQ